ncbi:MAG: tripartite tricarboxylate transporter permease [Clostridiaceae bacterium]|nr:tripartite tricarboxylate transporter permease [Clostridiaceae bacterium]
MFLEDLGTAFHYLIQWQNIIGMIFGVILGQWMGALPGLTSGMAIAVLIPLTYYLEPWVAITMLIGIYKGGLCADSISAILLNTPGMPAAAVVCRDGHPLARQGKAGKAMKMSIYAAFTGDMIANFSLIFFSGILATFALQFGPPEFTSLIVFALTIVAGVTGKSFLKGIIAAAMGLLFAVVGSDPMTGLSRFTFGRMELIDGLPLVPVLIGILAMSEIIKQLEAPLHEMQASMMPMGTSREDNRISFKEYLGCSRELFGGGIIGAICGAIPGLGATVASFLSYNEAKRISKHPERFGNGAIEGIAAADSAASAVAGSNMIPLLAFGIPGDVVAAILLGAFLVHGITPGPLIFQTQAPIIYTIFMGMIVAGIINLFIGQAFVKISSNVLKVSRRILYPLILVTAVVGSYSFNGRLFDVKVMIFCGILGYFMNKLGYAPIAFVVGFVLGPTLETWFRRAASSSFDISIFFTRPISLLFIVLAVVSIFIIMKQRKVLLERE